LHHWRHQAQLDWEAGVVARIEQRTVQQIEQQIEQRVRAQIEAEAARTGRGQNPEADRPQTPELTRQRVFLALLRTRFGDHPELPALAGALVARSDADAVAAIAAAANWGDALR
jgi:hypothetical protein